uniref:Uncharacterized protein n=1 Tax=Lotus japonicus TaxID=34305 RepID=I3SVV7_LOTJA|nr:unknown [Lotus japonicus]
MELNSPIQASPQPCNLSLRTRTAPAEEASKTENNTSSQRLNSKHYRSLFESISNSKTT